MNEFLSNVTLKDVSLILALISSSIFILQFLLSLILGELDIDTDTDVGDIDLGDIFSFKGITHFFIGCGWTTYLFNNILVGIFAGIITVLVLFYVCKFLYSLGKTRRYETKYDLVGRKGTVVLSTDRYTEISISLNGALTNVEATSESKTIYKVGDIVEVKDYDQSSNIIIIK